MLFGKPDLKKKKKGEIKKYAYPVSLATHSHSNEKTSAFSESPAETMSFRGPSVCLCGSLASLEGREADGNEIKGFARRGAASPAIKAFSQAGAWKVAILIRDGKCLSFKKGDKTAWKTCPGLVSLLHFFLEMGSEG